jgi:hypothetical protein
LRCTLPLPHTTASISSCNHTARDLGFVSKDLGVVAVQSPSSCPQFCVGVPLSLSLSLCAPTSVSMIPDPSMSPSINILSLAPVPLSFLLPSVLSSRHARHRSTHTSMTSTSTAFPRYAWATPWPRHPLAPIFVGISVGNVFPAERGDGRVVCAEEEGKQGVNVIRVRGCCMASHTLSLLIGAQDRVSVVQ